MARKLGKEFEKAADLLASIMGPHQAAGNKYDQLSMFAQIHAGIIYGENLTFERAQELILDAVKKAETTEQFQSNVGDLYEQYTGARGVGIILSPH